MRRTMTLLAGILLATPVFAGMTNDRLCQAIGDTPNVSRPAAGPNIRVRRVQATYGRAASVCKRKTDATCSW
jgi:hypothetical protein